MNKCEKDCITSLENQLAELKQDRQGARADAVVGDVFYRFMLRPDTCEIVLVGAVWTGAALQAVSVQPRVVC